MVSLKEKTIEIWRLFSREEKRNILIYIIGIMFYKFGLESFNGSILTLATNRYDQDAHDNQQQSQTFQRIGLLSGLNQGFQCLGSILIAPLVKRYRTRTVLSISIFIFGIFAAILLIVDAATGGRIKPRKFSSEHENDFNYYGNYPTDAIIPIYCLTGITYGMVELIRRIIPRDIVGGDSQKLQRMDALVHIFYELSGTAAAFFTALVLIPRLGNNYAFIITPILFGIAAVIWWFISAEKYQANDEEDIEVYQENPKKENYFLSVVKRFLLFGKSVYIGGKIIFTNRRFIWLWSGYSLALYGHRYLENGIAPQIAKRYLKNAEWSQIIVGGSNLGELLGAFVVFLLANRVKTPMPWLRLDALFLLIIWYIPFYYPPMNQVAYAWIIAATFIPISFGWAAGDVSLGAYIQSSISQLETENKQVSPLGAVMAFLYSSYIILYAILNPLLGKYIDSIYNSQATVRPALLYTAAVQLSIISAIVFLSTFIPKGAFAFNPKLLQSQYDENQQSTQTSQTNEQNSDVDLNTYF